MPNGEQKLRWAQKVRREKIRRLYETDAKGIIDEELIDEVGYAFYARCQSILTVTEASRGRVKCPSCGNIIPRSGVDKEQILKCDRCSWEITWGEYFQSYHRKQLHGGGAVEVFEDFVEQFPKKKTPQEKMILIDKIVHECHKGLKEGEYTRPVAANLIAGKMFETIALLEELAYGTGSTSGTKEIQAAWQEKMDDALRRWGINEE